MRAAARLLQAKGFFSEENRVALVRGRRHVQAYPAQKPPKAWFN